MIRVLAASLSAAAFIAGSLPAEAQQRHQGTSFRAPGQPNLAAKRLPGPKQLAGQRRFRSFNPPAPQITSGPRSHRSFNPPAPLGQAANPPRALSRGLAPPTPGGATTHRYLYPEAPTGGQNFVGGPGSVPASLPPPSPAETSPTAAPAAPGPQETAAVQPAEGAPQGDLQPPIPESITAQFEPVATMAKADKLVPGPVVQQVVQVPVPQQVVRHECEARVVYVPIYRERKIYRRHHVHAPYYTFRGHRAHFGHRVHFGFRRW